MSYFPSDQASARAQAGLSTGLLAKVFGLLAFSIAFAAVGGVVGAQLGRAWLLPLFITEFALIFAIQGLREREGWNFALLYAFAFVSGATIGPLVASYVNAGLGGAVLQAGGITVAMTAGLGGYALVTKRDLSGLGPYLMAGLIGLFVAMIVNIFVGGSVMYGLLSWAGAGLFSILLVYRVNQVRYLEDTMANAVVVTLGIYLTIMNLFLFVLRIVGGGGGGRR
ncbi:MAG: Bax inhibitor-1 family protein [Dehalococcoidia bacterium]